MKPLSTLLEEFLSYTASLNQSRHTVRVMSFSVRRMLRWLDLTYGVTTPERLTRQHLEKWARHTAQRRTITKGLPLKPTTISKQFEGDRAFLRWLQRQGVVPAGFHEVIPQIKLPDLLPTSVLAHAQVVRLLGRIDVSTPEGLQMRAMAELLYSSGIRPDELLGLNTGDLDLPNKLGRVMGKGQKERIVPFGNTAQRYLESYLRGVRPLMLREPTEVAVWLDRFGRRMPYHTFRRRLVELAKDLKLPANFTSYTFRRSCTTELVRGGANLWHVKDLLGHESLETLKHYTKLVAVDLKKTHARYHPRERDRK